MYEIIKELNTKKEITIDESFYYASMCSKLLCSKINKDKVLGRKILIHILDNWNKVPNDTYPIWSDLIESAGFYPYIEKNKETIKLSSLADEIRAEYYQSDFLENKWFHKEQKKISEFLLAGKNVIASAPTSFGKSLLIEEIVASHKYRNIVIIQPTLALLDETRKKMSKYSNDYKLIVRTSQLPLEKGGNLFLLTAERVMEYENFPKIDLLIIDEFYKLSLRRKDERADTLNNAFLKIVGTFHSKFYLLGPNIDGITEGFAKSYNAIFYKSDFSLVDCLVTDVSNKINFNQSEKRIDNEKEKYLFELLIKLKNEQTIIYCSTPARARKFAKDFLQYILNNEIKVNNVELPVIEWITKNINPKWSLIDELRKGISIHDGSLPKHIGTSILKYFNSGLLKYIFCTSTIIEGVNTSAKNIILFDNKKGNSFIDFFDYSNIKGRSGRLMEHYVGRIYNFVPIPKKESVIIDIPFYEQNPNILTDEILINIPPKDISVKVNERYNKLINNIYNNILLDIIKKNGVNINGQLNIYYALERDIEKNYSDIVWSQMPTWKNILYVLNLAQDNIFSISKDYAIASINQLVYYLDKYRKDKSIGKVVSDIYLYKISRLKLEPSEEQKSNYLDNAIRDAFHIYRKWFRFTIPKVFRVVDSIQRYVCITHNIKPGSYSYFVQQLENDFIKDNLSLLMEFGIPSDTVRKIAPLIPEDLDEDSITNFIRNNKKIIFKNLLKYEIDIIEECL